MLHSDRTLGSGLRRLSIMLTAATALTIGPPALGQSQPSSSGQSEIEQADDVLGSSSYRLIQPIAAGKPIAVTIDLSRQLADIRQDGVLIAVTRVSTGMAGHETPTGTFTVLQKDAHHHSNRYDDAPMRYMQRLTWDGIAIHAGEIGDTPSSHGCIRMPLAVAKLIFSASQAGTTVTITDGLTVPPMEDRSDLADDSEASAL